MQKPKVLIVEDNKDIVEMYDVKFTREGFDVVEAYDGESGLQKAIDEHPDLILLDVMMPNMDGFEVLHALRNNTSLNVPIIILSNLGQQEQIEKGYQLGATAYIVKANYTPSEVVDKVKSFLAEKNPPAHFLELQPDRFDYEKFMQSMPDPVKARTCDSCWGEVLLELSKHNHSPLQARFVCIKCGKEFA
ncbi:MAG: response regulator [bacterium]